MNHLNKLFSFSLYFKFQVVNTRKSQHVLYRCNFSELCKCHSCIIIHNISSKAFGQFIIKAVFEFIENAFMISKN